jgi:hypothetical protein
VIELPLYEEFEAMVLLSSVSGRPSCERTCYLVCRANSLFTTVLYFRFPRIRPSTFFGNRVYIIAYLLLRNWRRFRRTRSTATHVVPCKVHV